LETSGILVSPESITSNSTRVRPTKHVGQNKRRALNGNFEYSIHSTSDFSSHLLTDNKSYSDFSGNLYADFSDDYDEPNSTSIYEESVIFDEENAVILLSTAFRTIPHGIHDVDINIDINGYHDIGMDDFGDSSFVDDNSKKRGSYSCGKCGKRKKGHVCTVPSPSEPTFPPQPTHTPLSQQLAATIPLQPTFPLQVDVSVPVVIAQPVVS